MTSAPSDTHAARVMILPLKAAVLGFALVLGGFFGGLFAGSASAMEGHDDQWLTGFFLPDGDAVDPVPFDPAASSAVMERFTVASTMAPATASTLALADPSSGVAVSESWAVTGGFQAEDVTTQSMGQSDLGIRFSTRAGEQLVVSVEPGVSWSSDRAEKMITDPRGMQPARVKVGARATYSITDAWFVSGVAQFERGVTAFDGNLSVIGQTNVVGGFLTGVRF